MKTYEVSDFGNLVRGNSYVGRGILTGMTPAGEAFNAYFIMGRSDNSRNRVFREKNGEIFTEPYDASRVEDPSLIIYAAVRKYENHLIVTNGDQTDTIYEGYRAGKCMRGALKSRCFEPDAPNLTPRISSVTDFLGGSFRYSMSILKSGDVAGTVCNRYTFDYEPLPGLGHFLHTYEGDDDMPAHAKSTLVGTALTLPVSRGRINLGTWQGIYLCEFRNRAAGRRIVATVVG